MKRLFTVVLLSAMAISAFALKSNPAYRDARRSGAIAKMQIHAIDDLGHGVPNADVTVFMGMNFRPKGYSITGRTDANGVFFAEGKTCGDEINIEISKAGYYSSVKKLCFAEMGAEHDVSNGKWQPFGDNMIVALRRIMNPVDVIVHDKLIDVAQTNVWLGFDMEKKDFVKPAGNGLKSDFEVKVEWDGLPAWESKMCSAEIRFLEEKTGGYYVRNKSESAFPYAYEAQIDSAYLERSISIVDRDGDPHTTKVSFAKDSSFVTRTRTVVDEQGNIKSANYGSIRRIEIGPSRRGVALLRLSYIFNPIPNDTNLESK